MRSVEKHAGDSALRVVGALYCSGLWAMALALLATQWTWLEMRFNVGWVLFGGWPVLFVLLLCVRAVRPGLKFTIASMVGSAIMGFAACGGLQGLSIVPACLVREGLMHGSWPLGTVNLAIGGFIVLGPVIAIAVHALFARKGA
jgi:hypothetical protein